VIGFVGFVPQSVVDVAAAIIAVVVISLGRIVYRLQERVTRLEARLEEHDRSE
jgi:hypothetical protein